MSRFYIRKVEKDLEYPLFLAVVASQGYQFASLGFVLNGSSPLLGFESSDSARTFMSQNPEKYGEGCTVCEAQFDMNGVQFIPV